MAFIGWVKPGTEENEPAEFIFNLIDPSFPRDYFRNSPQIYPIQEKQP